MAIRAQSHHKVFTTTAHIVRKHTTQAKARQINTNYFVVKNAKMSKATINTIKRANKRQMQTKLDRAIDVYESEMAALCLPSMSLLVTIICRSASAWTRQWKS